MLTLEIPKGSSGSLKESSVLDGAPGEESLLAYLDQADTSEPQRALAAGILRQAAVDLRKFAQAKDQLGRELYLDARSWFTSADTYWPYAFLNVCNTLQLPPEAVIDEVFRDADASWYVHSGNMARRVARSVTVSLADLFHLPRAHRSVLGR